jgi:DNA-binding transcriptional MerR regulator
VEALLTIGDFSRATHLSIASLRKYHESGLLEPASVDSTSFYRHYAIEQIATAQIIRRFRSLDMPLADIRSVLSAPDLKSRNDLIAAHLTRLEGTLAKTQDAVSSLRDLLQPPLAAPDIEHRSIPATTAASITEVLNAGDAWDWFHGAIGELQATLNARHQITTGPAGGIFSSALFADERGEGTIFIPFDGEIGSIGRVRQTSIPSLEAAVITHAGAYSEMDLSYGALAQYVTKHALSVDGPIREYYVVGPLHTPDEEAWVTEIAWPIFQTRAGR